MSDPLTRSSDALRKHAAAPNLRSGLTRARLLDNAAKRYSGRRRVVLRWLVPVASVFVVGTALARVAESWPALREVMTFSSHEPRPRSLPPRAAKRKRPAALAPARADRGRQAAADPGASALPGPSVGEPAAAFPAVSAAQQPPAPVSSTPALRASAPPARARRSVVRAPAKPIPESTTVDTSATSSPVALPRPAPGDSFGPAASPHRAGVASADLALFRRAQTLHLAHDPAAALSAWDAYLRVAVHGVLVPEARYNRALCLIRLGRNAEARSALSPFAQAPAPGYRRAEARALLAALPR